MKLLSLFLGISLCSFFPLSAATGKQSNVPSESIVLNAQAHYIDITGQLLALSDKWFVSEQIKTLLDQAQHFGILDMILFHKTLADQTLLQTFIIKEKKKSTLTFIKHSEKQHLIISDKLGKTAAHLLVEYFDDPELLTALYNKYPEAFEAEDNKKNTPLHYAIMMKKIQSIPLLIKYAPRSIEAKNNEGSIPAHYCTAATISFFSEHQSILNIENNAGVSVQKMLFENFNSKSFLPENCTIS